MKSQIFRLPGIFLLTALLVAGAEGLAADTAQRESAPGYDEAVSPSSDETDSERYQDRHLKQRALLRLYESPSLAGSTLDLTMVGDGVVVLSGAVGSDAHRERALHITRSTLGIYRVTDRLRIDPYLVDSRAGVQVDDDALAEKAASTLADLFETAESRKTWLFGYEIDGLSWEFDVDVDEGIASLSGTVARLQHITRAAESVWEIPGIRAVRVDLEVEDDEPNRLFEQLRPEDAPLERPPLTPPSAFDSELR